MTETLEVYETISGGVIVSLREEDAPVCSIAAGDVHLIPVIAELLKRWTILHSPTL